MRNETNTLLAGVAALAAVRRHRHRLGAAEPTGQEAARRGISEQSGTHAQSAKPSSRRRGMEQHAQAGPAGGAKTDTKTDTKAAGAAATNAKAPTSPRMAQQGAGAPKAKRARRRSNAIRWRPAPIRRRKAGRSTSAPTRKPSTAARPRATSMSAAADMSARNEQRNEAAA